MTTTFKLEDFRAGDLVGRNHTIENLNWHRDWYLYGTVVGHIRAYDGSMNVEVDWVLPDGSTTRTSWPPNYILPITEPEITMRYLELLSID
jgi:hypothetical protein